MKTCSKCKKGKPLKAFYIYKRSKDGRRSDCKECVNIQNRTWYKTHPERKRESGRAYKLANLDKKRATDRAWREINFKRHQETTLRNQQKRRMAWVEIIKARGMDKCAKCDYNRNFAAIDFHHTDPKEKEVKISLSMNKRPTPERLAELDKCIALCANCHRELHHPKHENLE